MPRYSLACALVLAMTIITATAARGQGQPLVAMPGGAQYGIRIPSKLPGCYAPVASNLIGSDEDHHTNRGSPTLAYDWSASVGSPIFSICPGVVRRASSANEGGYGWNIIIDHGNGVSTLYAHCKENSFRVRAGDPVTAWTPICVVGRTGMTSWPHVHLNIDINGQHTRVGAYFEQSLLRHCHFTQCQATNAPDAPIFTDRASASAVVSGQQPAHAGQQSAYLAQQPAQFWYAPFITALAAMTPAARAALSFAIPTGIALLLWLTSGLVRVVVISMLASAIVTVGILILVAPALAANRPVAIPPSVGNGFAVGTTLSNPTLPPAGLWKAAYNFVSRWEGRSCTEDGAHTYAGVTQGAYNRYRARHGLPAADVCGPTFTEAQKQGIFYEDYWLAAGADKLPAALAIIHADFAYNVGAGAKGPAMRILRQCGSDAACYIENRLRWYLTECGNCAQGHINRTKDVVNYVKQLAANAAGRTP